MLMNGWSEIIIINLTVNQSLHLYLFLELSRALQSHVIKFVTCKSAVCTLVGIFRHQTDGTYITEHCASDFIDFTKDHGFEYCNLMLLAVFDVKYKY